MPERVGNHKGEQEKKLNDLHLIKSSQESRNKLGLDGRVKAAASDAWAGSKRLSCT